MIDLKNLVLQDLLPEHLIQDGDAGILIEIMNEEIRFLNDIVTKQSAPDDLMELPDEVIEHLMWEEHIYPNEGGYLAFTKTEKAELIRSAYDLHRKKGTVYAIERVLDVVRLNGEVVEWKDYNADPYHFIVELQPSGKLSNLKDVRTLVSEFKNTRSWFDGFVIVVSDEFFLIFDQTYHYPVFFKECGEFGGEALFKHFESGAANVLNATYDYSVSYEVNEIHSSLYQEGVGLENETYQYKTTYPLCGELETINSTSHMVQSDSFIENESYFFGTQYPTCGEFYCEED